MEVGNRIVTVKGILKLVEEKGHVFFPLTKHQAFKNWLYPEYINWNKYFPSTINRNIKSLHRKGAVEVIKSQNGVMVSLTEKGKKYLLHYDLDKFLPKSGKWDHVWRLIFFDIQEINHTKRDLLRKYLVKLGCKPMQESVYVSPYDISKEVKYLREVLEISHDVKLGELTKLENSEDLQAIFSL